MSGATKAPTDTSTDTQKEPSHPIARVTYRNGSGHRTLTAVDYGITPNGHLKVVDDDERKHVLSKGAQWKISEVRD